MAAMMNDCCSTFVDLSPRPAFASKVTSGSSAPKTYGFSGYSFDVLKVSLPPTHEKSREVNMGRLYSVLSSYERLGYDWDGYGGEPANHCSMVDAIEFLQLLPLSSEVPIPMLAGDGEISLFWEARDNYLEASFPGDGTFHYIFNSGVERFASLDLSLNETKLGSEFFPYLRKV
jgi:hypothetical protein